jgi:hypothetical protein
MMRASLNAIPLNNLLGLKEIMLLGLKEIMVKEIMGHTLLSHPHPVNT